MKHGWHWGRSVRQRRHGVARRWRAWRTGGAGQAGILLYHRVAHLAADPQQLAVEPQRFADQLSALAADGWRVLPLNDLVEAIRRKTVPKRALAITFDDGYQDNLEHAKPVLMRLRMPATIYVATGCCRDREPFWWDALEVLLSAADGSPPLMIDGHRLPLADRSGRQQAYAFLHRLLLIMRVAERQRIVHAVRGWMGSPMWDRLPRPLSPEGIQQLAGGGLIEVGAHTRYHPSLAILSRAAQAHEIVSSRDELGGWLGREPRAFSYPFGTPADFTATTMRLVQRAGFRHATANWAEPVTSLSDPFALPRFIVRDWDGATLLRRLHAWLPTA